MDIEQQQTDDTPATAGGFCGCWQRASSCRRWFIVAAVSSSVLGIVAFIVFGFFFGCFLSGKTQPTSTVIYSNLPNARFPSNFLDLEPTVIFVLGDMNALLSSDAITYPPPTILTFRQDADSVARGAISNDAFYDSLPSDIGDIARKNEHENGNSPSISGNGCATAMLLPYSTFSANQRVGNVAHEFYHVLQQKRCAGSVGGFAWPAKGLVWMIEGGAATFEAAYKLFYFNDGGDIADMDNGLPWDNGRAIQNTRQEAQNGFVFGKAQESYEGLISNYDRARTAMLFLASKASSGGLDFVLRDFIFSRDMCEALLSTGEDKSAAFNTAFGMTLESFYSDLNQWLQDSNAEVIAPTREQIDSLFRNQTATFPVPLVQID